MQQKSIALSALTGKVGNRPIQLTRMLRTGKPRCTARDAKAILDACHAHLEESCLAAHGSVQGPSRLAELERQICMRLLLPGDRPTVDCLSLDDSLARVASVEELALDDLSRWDSSRPWHGAHLPDAAIRSLAYLETAPRAALLAETVEQQLRVAHMAVALATHHPPGATHHRRALALAHRAASRAGVLAHAMASDQPAEVRASALRILVQLHWCGVAPHRSSPNNYLGYALGRHRVDPNLWRHADGAYGVMAEFARMRAAVSGDQNALQEASSIISYRARMLLVVGDAASRREANKLNAEAMSFAQRVSAPYGFAFPILRAIVDRRIPSATSLTTHAIERCEAGGDSISASAFAGLLLQLTAKDGRATADSRIVKLATDAAKSPQRSYLFTHVFQPEETRRLLGLPATV